MKKITLIFITLLMASACATPILNTKEFKPNPEVQIGVPYYLPKALIPITITLEDNPAPTNGDNAVGNTGGQGNGSNSEEEAKGNKANNNVGKNKNDVALATLAKKEKNTPKSASETTTGKPEDQPAQAPKPSTPPDKQDDVLPEAKIGQYILTMGAPLLVPDTTEPYFLEYKPESATEDDVSIGIGVNQLLQTTKATSIDKSGEALLTIAKIGIEAAKLPFSVAAEGKTKERCNRKFQPTKISTYIDTTLSGDGELEGELANDTTQSKDGELKDKAFHPFSLGALNKLLEANKVPMEFHAEPVNKPATENKDPTKNSGNTGPHNRRDRQNGTSNTSTETSDTEKKNRGVLFRASKPYILKLSFGPEINMDKKTDWCVVKETRHLMAVVPDKNSQYAVDVSRGALITKKTDLTIANGMLTKIDVNKPSSLIGVLNVPLDIIKLVLSVPKDLLTFRYEKIAEQGKLTEAQATQLKNEIDRLNNEKDLREALDAIEAAKKSL